MRADTPWAELKPGAPYGATHGRYFAGLTLLEAPAVGVIVCGVMTCDNRENAERHAERYRHDRREIDRGAITRASFLALVADLA